MEKIFALDTFWSHFLTFFFVKKLKDDFTFNIHSKVLLGMLSSLSFKNQILKLDFW